MFNNNELFVAIGKFGEFKAGCGCDCVKSIGVRFSMQLWLLHKAFDTLQHEVQALADTMNKYCTY